MHIMPILQDLFYEIGTKRNSPCLNQNYSGHLSLNLYQLQPIVLSDVEKIC
jgi:hypothetical protein